MERVIDRRRDKRIGERHFAAKMTDEDVRLARELHEQHRLGYGTLAQKFDVAKSTMSDICRYRRR